MTRRAALIAGLLALAFGCAERRFPSIERRSPLPEGAAAVTGGGVDPKTTAVTTRFQTGPRTFVFALIGEPETLDPGKARGVNENLVVSNLFEGLVDTPLGAGDPIPGVAERWTISGDGLVYTFHLRPDAKWSNGDPVTAEDFRYSWLRVLDPKTASPYADMLFPIAGAEAFYRGQGADPKSVGVEVVDALTLRVTLAHVAPYFLELCTFYTYLPVHRATVEAHGDRWTRPEHMVSNGPYRLVEWLFNQRVVGEKNPHYWGRDRLGIDRFEALPIEEATTMVTVYESGNLDWSGAVDLPAIKHGILSRRPDYHEDPYLGVYFYRYNVTEPVLVDNRVRQALAMAVDREAIVKVIKMGITPAVTYVPPMPGYIAGETDVRFDPDRARALLTEAGYPGGEGFPRLQLLYNTQENHKRIAEMVQQMWDRHLGITVDLENQEWKVYLKSQQALSYDISRSGWIGDYLDPMTFLGMWTEGNGNNNTGWADREYDGLLTRARFESDPQARLAILRDAETILLQRGPVLPVYHYARAYLLNPAVEGFRPHPQNLHPIKYIRKTR